MYFRLNFLKNIIIHIVSKDKKKKEFHQDTHLDISYRNRNSLVRDNHVVISRTSLILSVSYYFQLFIFGA